MTIERAASTRYLTAHAAAAYLGVSKRTFYGHVRDDVRAVRIGSRIVFDTVELDRWAAAHTDGDAPDSGDDPPAVELRAPNEARQELLRELQAQPDMQRVSKRTRALIERLGRT